MNALKPFKLLLVSFTDDWRKSLNQSLANRGYVFELTEAADKSQALLACAKKRHDVLIANTLMPDGSPEELFNALHGSMACLTVGRGRVPHDWALAIDEVIQGWKATVALRTRHFGLLQHELYEKALERCRSEIDAEGGRSIEKVLGVVLEVMEVSRVYLHETPGVGQSTLTLTQEVSAPGHLPILGSQRSNYEVAVRHSDGRVLQLGVEDVVNKRKWNAQESGFVNRVAYLIERHPSFSRTAPRPLGLLGARA